MSSINKATLIGNVGREPEIRQTQAGKEIANLTLATSERWTDKNSGERKESTEWHNVVIFNEGLVKVVKNYVHKGSKLYIEGAIKTRKWTDSNGSDKYTTEIVLQGYSGSLVMLDSRGGQSDSNQQAGYSDAPSQAPSVPELDDEIPF